jgi:hypothetical protein
MVVIIDCRSSKMVAVDPLYETFFGITKLERFNTFKFVVYQCLVAQVGALGMLARMHPLVTLLVL